MPARGDAGARRLLAAFVVVDQPDQLVAQPGGRRDRPAEATAAGSGPASAKPVHRPAQTGGARSRGTAEPRRRAGRRSRQRPAHGRRRAAGRPVLTQRGARPVWRRIHPAARPAATQSAAQCRSGQPGNGRPTVGHATGRQCAASAATGGSGGAASQGAGRRGAGHATCHARTDAHDGSRSTGRGAGNQHRHGASASHSISNSPGDHDGQPAAAAHRTAATRQRAGCAIDAQPACVVATTPGSPRGTPANPGAGYRARHATGHRAAIRAERAARPDTAVRRPSYRPNHRRGTARSGRHPGADCDGQRQARW